MQPDVTVTLDTLHLVFSAFGVVQKIATFEKGQGFQALVQYSDAETAEQVRPTFKPILGLKDNACIITSLVIYSPAVSNSFFASLCPCLPCVYVAHLIFIWRCTGFSHTLQQHMQRADSAKHQAMSMGMCHYYECASCAVTWNVLPGFTHCFVSVPSIYLGLA